MTMRTPSPEVLQLQAAGRKLHTVLEREVHAQRLAGASWTAIARWLGTSRQAAHKRWRYLDLYDVCIGRVAGVGVVSSHDTGAVIGREQQAQVAAVGIITSQHPLSASW